MAGRSLLAIVKCLDNACGLWKVRTAGGRLTAGFNKRHEVWRLGAGFMVWEDLAAGTTNGCCQPIEGRGQLALLLSTAEVAPFMVGKDLGILHGRCGQK